MTRKKYAHTHTHTHTRGGGGVSIYSVWTTGVRDRRDVIVGGCYGGIGDCAPPKKVMNAVYVGVHARTRVCEYGVYANERACVRQPYVCVLCTCVFVYVCGLCTRTSVCVLGGSRAFFTQPIALSARPCRCSRLTTAL